MQGHLQPTQVLSRGTLLDPEALTIGFARRFATYKRATLLFRDLERLKHLLQNQWRPVQLVFAGEDYDMHMAKFLVQGVDVWLNTPRYPMEASGTSGQKAALNGVLHFSVADGWWEEGYNGANGWAIEPLTGNHDVQGQDSHDAEQLYRLLEQETVPLYYQRDLDGIPRGWIQLIKESLRTVAPRFCTKRMVKEYVSTLYLPAMARTPSAW